MLESGRYELDASTHAAAKPYSILTLEIDRCEMGATSHSSLTIHSKLGKDGKSTLLLLLLLLLRDLFLRKNMISGPDPTSVTSHCANVAAVSLLLLLSSCCYSLLCSLC